MPSVWKVLSTFNWTRHNPSQSPTWEVTHLLFRSLGAILTGTSVLHNSLMAGKSEEIIPSAHPKAPKEKRQQNSNCVENNEYCKRNFKFIWSGLCSSKITAGNLPGFLSFIPIFSHCLEALALFLPALQTNPKCQRYLMPKLQLTEIGHKFRFKIQLKIVKIKKKILQKTQITLGISISFLPPLFSSPHTFMNVYQYSPVNTILGRSPTQSRLHTEEHQSAFSIQPLDI